MENYYTDRLRANTSSLVAMRNFFHARINDRRVVVVGSASDPVFPPPSEHDYYICVNGSPYSLVKHLGATPHLTFLNASLFRDTGARKAPTHRALTGLNIGNVLINSPKPAAARATLADWKVGYESAFPITKYDKRLVLGDALGRSILGFYRHSANVSNGVFMAAFALWCGAREVVFVGFSFNDTHEYSRGQSVPRAHIAEDKRFLDLAKELDLPIETTAPDFHARLSRAKEVGVA